MQQVVVALDMLSACPPSSADRLIDRPNEDEEAAQVTSVRRRKL